MNVKYKNGDKYIELDLPGVEDSKYMEVLSNIVKLLEPQKFNGSPDWKIGPNGEVILPEEPSKPVKSPKIPIPDTFLPKPILQEKDVLVNHTIPTLYPQPTGVARTSDGRTLQDLIGQGVIQGVDGLTPGAAEMAWRYGQLGDGNGDAIPFAEVKDDAGVPHQSKSKFSHLENMVPVEYDLQGNILGVLHE